MGLDMYLRGEKYIFPNWNDPESNPSEDGFRVVSCTLEIGYWRKHPNLHGYIVATFAEGVDECQKIELDSEQLKKIIDAVKANNLPPTKGFFFGRSDGTEADEDIKILTKAVEWLKVKEEYIMRSVYYRASW